MRKPVIAALIAFLMTACIGVGIFMIGGAALFNKNSSPVSNSPAQTVSLNTTGQTDQVSQLQNQIAQYQQREQEYQQREQQLQDQLTQVNAQLQADQEVIQQAQMLLQALQERGVIRISDGRIFINQ